MLPERQALSNGRWRFRHGPIDLVVRADGDPAATGLAHAAAWQRFGAILPELVGELARLRAPVDASSACPLQGPVAQRMWRACAPHAAGGAFITPMAAVAGAVAEALLAVYARPGIVRAWANNGGDIALRLAPGATVRIGLVADLAGGDRSAGGALRLDGGFEIDATSPVRGVATSGWRGRSFSLGIADSVTVLARSAAAADAAATVVANAVDLDDPRIVRTPADRLKDDSDLGARLVTVDVPPLEPAALDRALDRGAACAEALRRRGLIEAALLVCQDRVRSVGGYARFPRAAWTAPAAAPPATVGRRAAPAAVDRRTRPAPGLDLA